MQALDVLAEEFEIFEETKKKVTHDTEDGDMSFAVASEFLEELDNAQREQDRLQDDPLRGLATWVVVTGKLGASQGSLLWVAQEVPLGMGGDPRTVLTDTVSSSSIARL